MGTKNTTYCFMLLYIASFALAKWWYLPVLGYQFQATEVLFLLGILLIFFGKLPFRWRGFDALDWGISALLVMASIGALGGDLKGSLSGVIGWIYLYLAYLLFSRIQVDRSQKMEIVANGWLGAALLSSLGGILGILSWQLGWHTFLVHEKYLPYWGEGVRAASFVRHPDVAFNLIVYALIFYACLHYRDRIVGRRWGAVLAGLILLAGVLLSFSKFLMLLPWVFLLLLIRLKSPHSAIQQLIVYALASAGVILFLIATHFFFTTKSSWEEHKGRMDAFITDKIVWEDKEIAVIETAYMPLKRTAQQAGWENLPFGIGMGQFPEYLMAQQQKGLAPAIPAYDVHASFWGLWAESGLLGGTGGVIFLFCLLNYVWKREKEEKTAIEQVYWIAVTTMLVYVLIEGVVLDGLHFRHHWFLLVLLSWGKSSTEKELTL